jgi:glycosyltransferase involved in cell wall biosynthesis
MIRICNAMVSFGYDVLLVGRELDTSVSFKDEVFKQKRLKCFFNKGVMFYAEFNIRLLLFLLFQKVDIIGSIDDDTLTACGIAKLIKRKKLVFDSHEYFSEVPELVGKNRIKKVWLFIEKVFMEHVDLAYTVSTSIADIYAKKYQIPFYTIMNCPEKFEGERKDNFLNKIIIYQGALNLGRGLEELIEAMKDVDATLWIVGEGDHSHELRELASQKLYAHKIIFHGYIQPNLLNILTQQATVGFNVLQDLGISYQLSLSNKFFDYIQLHIPSLSSDFIEYKHIIDKHKVGIMCKCDSKDIASSLNLLLNDATLYKKMKSECAIASELFYWGQEKLKLKTLYEKL